MIEEKLAAYSSMAVKLEESMQVFNSNSCIKTMIDEMNSLRTSMEGKLNNLKNINSHRESLESQVFEEIQDTKVPGLELDLLQGNNFDAKEVAFNTTQMVNILGL